MPDGLRKYVNLKDLLVLHPNLGDLLSMGPLKL